ncbi:MAG: PKD domain-containing protein [Chlorobi bacterium]|nr:PKD domain-containing protein [Chlorobiota bacterium]
MKHFIPVILFVSFLFIEPGCKKAIEDAIDCGFESALLSIDVQIDGTNPKLVHFEFINNDTDGRFTLDPEIKWDFGDGKTETSSNHKIEHTYPGTGDYDVKATYTLRRGTASCTGPKEVQVSIN